MSGIGKILGIDQEKIVAALSEKVKEQFGGMTVGEFAEKFGGTHQLEFSVSIVDNQVKGKVWLEGKSEK